MPYMATKTKKRTAGANGPTDESSTDTVHPEPGAEEVEASIALGANLTVESILEALLFSTDVPLPASKLVQLLGIGTTEDVKQHVEALNNRYEATGAAFRAEAIAKGYQLLTLPVFNPWVGKLQKSRSDARLSHAALETLAIVAYKQPVLRADIEAVRGVACGDMLVRLREVNLVRIVGRAEEIGRPLLYGTTTKFLDVFGLSSLKDLPKLDPDKPNEWPPLRVTDAGAE